MPGSPNQKMKLLYLMKILLDKSDENNPVTVTELITELSRYDINAERKSIYTDIESLRRFGLDIETQKNKSTGYYIASRQFELPELKILVDAVESFRSITRKKSDALIKKLAALTSHGQAKQLKRQLFIPGRPKNINETVYYNIDQIHLAINDGKKVGFRYFDYNILKERIYRKKGDAYQNTPVTLCWSEDKYYLVAYSAMYENLMHFRIDRMTDVSILDERRDVYNLSNSDISAHINRMFGMYDGEHTLATLSFENSLTNVVIDHFGIDVQMRASEEGWFDIVADVSISPVFLAWMFQFGEYAYIKSPQSLIDAMKSLLKENRRNY